MNKIRMIALDLDGTLLTREKELTERTRAVLEKAIRQGVTVLVATGRPFEGVPKELKTFPGMRYALTANGARILDVEKDELLYENPVPLQIAGKVLDVYERYDTIQEIYYDGIGYANADKLEIAEEYFREPAMLRYVLETRRPVENIRVLLETMGRPVDKVQAIFRNLEEKAQAIKDLEEVEGISATGALHNNIEVNHIGVNKGSGILRLGEMLKIEREEIMVCGDGMNDVEMLREAGFAVAMANAHPDVKAVADYITETNDEEGVANAIERFVLEKEGE